MHGQPSAQRATLVKRSRLLDAPRLGQRKMQPAQRLPPALTAALPHRLAARARSLPSQAPSQLTLPRRLHLSARLQGVAQEQPPPLLDLKRLLLLQMCQL